MPQRGAWLPAPHPLAPFLASSGAARPGHRRACPHHVLTRARARLRGVASWHRHGDTESCGHPTAPRGAPGTQPCCPDPTALQLCRFLPGHLQPWHGHRLPKARDVGTLGTCWWLSGQGWGRGSSGMGPVCPSTLQGSRLSARLWMCRWALNNPCLARGEPGGGCCGQGAGSAPAASHAPSCPRSPTRRSHGQQGPGVRHEQGRPVQDREEVRRRAGGPPGGVDRGAVRGQRGPPRPGPPGLPGLAEERHRECGAGRVAAGPCRELGPPQPPAARRCSAGW